MSSKMLVTIILLVIGFGIILLIYAQLNWKGQTHKEVCHESVVMRATLPGTFGIQEAIPLKCKTNKVCVRGDKFLDKAECGEFQNTEEVSYANVENLNQIEKLISQEIIDCWSIMGEGKVSLFSQYLAQTYGIGDVYPTCIICSRIAFDKQSLEEKGIDINERDVLQYMMTHKIPNNDKSYYDYLAGESPAKISVREKIDIPLMDKNGSITNQSTELDLRKIAQASDDKTEEIAVLFMQISTPTKKEVLLNSITTLAGGAATYTVVGGAKGLSLAKKGLVAVCGGPIRGIICGAVALIAAGAQQWSAEDNRGITATHCGDISVGEESRRGCSVVRTVGYNVDEINQYCAVIESIP